MPMILHLSGVEKLEAAGSILTTSLLSVERAFLCFLGKPA
jgi:hypothetical protein